MIPSLVRRAALAAAPLLVLLASPARAQQVIWHGRSGGFDIAWTDADVTARRVSDGRPAFSLRRVFDHDVAEMTGTHDDEVPLREYEERYRVLSVVGSVISLVDETYCDCGGMHPIAWTRFVSYDLARGTREHPFEVAATDLVAPRELLDALRHDRLLRQAMDAAHVHAFTSLRQLTSVLKDKEVQTAGDDCTYAVGEEFPTSWAMHHLENGRVALRFSLPHDVELCRGRYAQVGVLATPAPRVLADVAAADARRAGFLMKDAAAIAHQRETLLHWEAKAAK